MFMSEVSKVLGITGNEAKNFDALLKKNKLDKAEEYRPLFDENSDGKLDDGDVFNVRKGNKTLSIYNVAKGDALEKIAKKYGVTVEALIKANGIKDPNKLRADQFLVLPLPADVKDDPDTTNQYDTIKK